MPHVSKKKIDRKVLERISDFLLVSLTEIKDAKEMDLFVCSFLTKTERLMLAKRLGVAYLLNEGVPQEIIAEVLSIGRPTVERMSLFLKNEQNGYRVALNVLRKNELFKEFKRVFADILKKMSHPYRGILSQLHE